MIAVRFRAAICISVYHTQQRMSMRNKKVELLAPAGNVEAFYGAVHAGADAIYLGGNRFGARAYERIFRKMNWWTVSDMLTCWAEKYILP